MNKNRFTWKNFSIRQLELYAVTGFLFYVMWNSLELAQYVFEYFGRTLEGYGPPQQRWHRVIAGGFLVWALVITLMDMISVWHYTKNPDEIPKDVDSQ
ncbi:hypothetical protein WH43_09100 [Rheinheimera sp. KL1]|uniref:hypothetical protein n=1 Tax=Rheinheimera sp. KL1 TaxID=1635005 RepID=UPI0006A9CA75|nr:hypothetical protein [Rheinheimera sp. KL1]KOO58413.1 hypothetical protein WH43_09100 [Rheinheimera sp. KL1]